MENDCGILERIITLLAEKKVDQKDIISYLELPRGTFSNWIRRKSHSYYEYISEIAEYLGVTSEYLITGKDEKYVKTASICITNEDIDMIKMVKELSPEARRTVKDMIVLVHG